MRGGPEATTRSEEETPSCRATGAPQVSGERDRWGTCCPAGSTLRGEAARGLPPERFMVPTRLHGARTALAMLQRDLTQPALGGPGRPPEDSAGAPLRLPGSCPPGASCFPNPRGAVWQGLSGWPCAHPGGVSPSRHPEKHRRPSKGPCTCPEQEARSQQRCRRDRHCASPQPPLSRAEPTPWQSLGRRGSGQDMEAHCSMGMDPLFFL